MSEVLAIFAHKLKSVLRDAGLDTLTGNPDYIDLALIDIRDEADLNNIFDNEAPPVNPLAEFLALTLQQIELGQVDKVKLAINELLKDYLVKVNQENQQILTELYFTRLNQIFVRCMQADFPFHDEVWDYISNCLKSVGLYLFEKDFYVAVKLMMENLARMGRNAAQKGMPTSVTQACLRAMENKALDKERNDIARTAKNLRFNIEA